MRRRRPGVGGPGPMMTIFPFILIFVIMYFMVIRPQQKKAKEHQEMLNKLKKNDEVMTSGGIYGKVVDLKETVVTLEVAPNVRIRVHRPQIADCTHRRESDGEGRKGIAECDRSVRTRLIVFCDCDPGRADLFDADVSSSPICRELVGRSCCRRTGFTWGWIFKAAATWSSK